MTRTNPSEPIGVPEWVYLVDVPPEDPYAPLAETAERGLWVGILILAAVAVLAFLAGWLCRG